MGEGGALSGSLYDKVTFLGEVMSSPAVLRLEKEISVTNLWLWGGACETRVEPDIKQVGWGKNTRWWEGETPLTLATLCISLFQGPIVRCGREGYSLGSPGDRRVDGVRSLVKCKDPSSHSWFSFQPSRHFESAISPTPTPRDHSHTPSSLFRAVALGFIFR